MSLADAADERFIAALFDSFRRRLGRELIPAESSIATNETSESAAGRSRAALDRWSAVVVAHDTRPDPVFVYANQAALALWEMPAETFLGMPSRLSAEPLHRDERARLMERTKRMGFVDDYQGIRISATGRRFRIEQAILWNIELDGRLIGQAATFDRWTPLASSGPEAPSETHAP
ncbi:MAG TPA: MEKHLA domain-containing protein [Pirellulaceae bacterium]|nr:MEKHLA domain-containing protein [Pirellulaceae bacterium]